MYYRLSWVFLMLGILLFIGCGNGRAGGPDDETLKHKKIVVEASNGATDSVVPQHMVSGNGNRIFKLSLYSGTYLVDFSQVSYYEEDKHLDALLTIKDDHEAVKYYIVNKSKNKISDKGDLKLLFLQKPGIYAIELELRDSRDSWEISFIHKSQLNNEVQSTLKDPILPARLENNDTLYPYQWHLKNNGQNEYVVFDAVYGNDIDVEDVWDDNITGKGVCIAVVDEGVEINHPDLIENIDIKNCWNYSTKSYDTTPLDTRNSHGTAVAGIIAASGWNGIGGRGVAPNAKIVSFNMLESQGIVNWNLGLDSLVRGLDYVDIYNNSWGEVADGSLSLNPNTKSGPYYEFANQLAYGVKFGRKNRGAIYIKSSGNDREKFNEDSGNYEDNYWNANFSPIQVERYMIVVGASDADGSYSWYSTPGANLLLNAPGGDGQEVYLELDRHLIVTTDLSGKNAGYDYQDENLIDYHFDAKGNENYNYTDRMNGTSAAGPNVAGVVALMLEANPNLTWRDVRYILATTATKNGYGYITNSAGYSFSNDYGFGRVNAKNAVNKAKIWTNLTEQKSDFTCKFNSLSHYGGDLNLSTSGEMELNIESDFLVEYVNIRFSLENNETKKETELPDSSNIRVDLISPSHTISNLIHAPNGLNKDAIFERTILGSNAFLDESSKGIWRLIIQEVDNTKPPYKDKTDIRAFKVKNLKLEVFGYEK